MNLQGEALANIYVIPRAFDNLCKQEQQNKTKMLKAFANKGYVETREEKKKDKSIIVRTTVLKKIHGNSSQYIKFIFEDMPF